MENNIRKIPVQQVSLELIQYQAAMAFGQGAGTMIATPEALEYLLTVHRGLIERAARNWKAAQFAFADLTRKTGQLAAVYAAQDDKCEIGREHVERATIVANKICPC